MHHVAMFVTNNNSSVEYQDQTVGTGTEMPCRKTCYIVASVLHRQYP